MYKTGDCYHSRIKKKDRCPPLLKVTATSSADSSRRTDSYPLLWYETTMTYVREIPVGVDLRKVRQSGNRLRIATFETIWVHFCDGPATRSPSLKVALPTGFRMLSFPPSCYSSYGACTLNPGGTLTHCSCRPSLDAHISVLIGSFNECSGAQIAYRDSKTEIDPL
jgi:hypothetical protein